MRIHNRFFIPLILYISILYLVTTVQAAQVELKWDQSPSQVAGYVIYYGTSSKGNAKHPDDFTYEFSEVIENTDATSVTLEALPDGEMYYFAATAFDADGEESDFSNEVSTMIGSEVLSVAAARASGDDGSNGPANTLDGDFGTRWSANGQGQWLELDLGSVHTVGQVAIAWYLGNQREAVFDLEVSSDGVNWTPVFSGVSNGTTTDLETFSFSPVAARFVRYVGLGNSQSAWNSVTELQIFTHPDTEPPTPEPPDTEPPTPEPPIAELPITAARASGDDGSNGPANTLDGDFGTRWSANGQGQWLELDLGSVHTVGQVAIAWYLGNQREAVFDLEVSSDGVNWTPVFSGVSSGTTTELETFSFSPAAARFVRYVGFGNSDNEWNSVTEMQIFTPSDTAPPNPVPPNPVPPVAELPIAAVQASGDDGNGPANVLDGDFATRWSANGQGQWLELDLGSVHTVGQVAIAWYLGNRREAVFDLEVSSDGVNWTPVLRDQHSSGTTTDLETFSFSPIAARFVRYVGLGNSQSAWNSVTEVRLFAQSDTTPPTPEPPVAELPITAVQASGDDGNVPANVLDGDFATRWSANGQGQWLELELGSVHTVSQVAIAWYLGDRREAVFDLEVSSDGVNWTPVLRDQHSSGTTTDLETFGFSPIAARFVRYVGLGNSQSAWNSVTEVQISGF
jgi:hypothetical protein